MTTLPAHLGLIPRPFNFLASSEGLNNRLMELTGAVKVERAEHAKPEPLGYYRLDLGEMRGIRFGKVVHTACAQLVQEAAELANSALDAGVPAPPSMAPLTLDCNHTLFIHPWIEGNFSRGTRAEMQSLGVCLARLHAFFRTTGPPTAEAASFWMDSWASLENLAGNRQLGTEEIQGLRQLLTRHDEVQTRLRRQSQRLHNDLHPGNILFDEQGQVLAFLDFEEALTSWGYFWIDLAWVIERFCLMTAPLETARAQMWHFLHAYFPTGIPDEDWRLVLRDAILWKNYHALGVLHRQYQLTGRMQRDEWDKFIKVLQAAKHGLAFLTEASSVKGRFEAE
jgi:hypothetical protein